MTTRYYIYDNWKYGRIWCAKTKKFQSFETGGTSYSSKARATRVARSAKVYVEKLGNIQIREIS